MGFSARKTVDAAGGDRYDEGMLSVRTTWKLILFTGACAAVFAASVMIGMSFLEDPGMAPGTEAWHNALRPPSVLGFLLTPPAWLLGIWYIVRVDRAERSAPPPTDD